MSFMSLKTKAAAVALAGACFLVLLPLGAGASSDQRFQEQWGLHKIGAEAAWGSARGNGVLIAFLDSGVDLGHPDLRGNIVGGKDFIDGDDVPQDQNGHGTLTAGIAAAETGNGQGIAGVAPGANILPVRVFDGAGNGASDKVAAGIFWAVDEAKRRGSKLVLNLSFVGPGGSLLLVDDVRAAIDHAARSGAAVVAAAGNDGTVSRYNPASGSGIMVVGAHTREDACSSFSNYGDGVDILAPGGAGGRSSQTDILSTYLNGGYASSSGTSLATPFASGSVAVLMSQGKSAAGAVSRLTESGRGPGVSCRGESSSYKLLDLASAAGVSLVTSQAGPPPAPAPAARAQQPARPQRQRAARPAGAQPAPQPPPAPPAPSTIELPATLELPHGEEGAGAGPLAAGLELPLKRSNRGPISPLHIAAASLLVALGAAHGTLRLIFRQIR